MPKKKTTSSGISSYYPSPLVVKTGNSSLILRYEDFCAAPLTKYDDIKITQKDTNNTNGSGPSKFIDMCLVDVNNIDSTETGYSENGRIQHMLERFVSNITNRDSEAKTQQYYVPLYQNLAATKYLTWTSQYNDNLLHEHSHYTVSSISESTLTFNSLNTVGNLNNSVFYGENFIKYTDEEHTEASDESIILKNYSDKKDKEIFSLINNFAINDDKDLKVRFFNGEVIKKPVPFFNYIDYFAPESTLTGLKNGDKYFNTETYKMTTIDTKGVPYYVECEAKLSGIVDDITKQKIKNVNTDEIKITKIQNLIASSNNIICATLSLDITSDTLTYRGTTGVIDCTDISFTPDLTDVTITGVTMSGLSGTIEGGKITSGTIEGGTIEGGTIEGGTIEGGKITSGTITSGTLKAGETSYIITGGTLKAGETSYIITGGTLSAGDGGIYTITSGTIEDGTIEDGTIEGGKITSGTIEGGTITGGTITGGTITSGTITGGTITSGKITSNGTVSDTVVKIIYYSDTKYKVNAQTGNLSYNGNNIFELTKNSDGKTEIQLTAYNNDSDISFDDNMNLDYGNIELMLPSCEIAISSSANVLKNNNTDIIKSITATQTGTVYQSSSATNKLYYANLSTSLEDNFKGQYYYITNAVDFSHGTDTQIYPITTTTTDNLNQNKAINFLINGSVEVSTGINLYINVDDETDTIELSVINQSTTESVTLTAAADGSTTGTVTLTAAAAAADGSTTGTVTLTAAAAAAGASTTGTVTLTAAADGSTGTVTLTAAEADKSTTGTVTLKAAAAAGASTTGSIFIKKNNENDFNIYTSNSDTPLNIKNTTKQLNLCNVLYNVLKNGIGSIINYDSSNYYIYPRKYGSDSHLSIVSNNENHIKPILAANITAISDDSGKIDYDYSLPNISIYNNLHAMYNPEFVDTSKSKQVNTIDTATHKQFEINNGLLYNYGEITKPFYTFFADQLASDNLMLCYVNVDVPFYIHHVCISETKRDAKYQQVDTFTVDVYTSNIVLTETEHGTTPNNNKYYQEVLRRYVRYASKIVNVYTSKRDSSIIFYEFENGFTKQVDISKAVIDLTTYWRITNA